MRPAREALLANVRQGIAAANQKLRNLRKAAEPFLPNEQKGGGTVSRNRGDSCIHEIS